MRKRPSKVMACSKCGCTDVRACPGGCSWVHGKGEPPMCSACRPWSVYRLGRGGPPIPRGAHVIQRGGYEIAIAWNGDRAEELVAGLTASLDLAVELENWLTQAFIPIYDPKGTDGGADNLRRMAIAAQTLIRGGRS